MVSYLQLGHHIMKVLPYSQYVLVIMAEIVNIVVSKVNLLTCGVVKLLVIVLEAQWRKVRDSGLEQILQVPASLVTTMYVYFNYMMKC